MIDEKEFKLGDKVWFFYNKKLNTECVLDLNYMHLFEGIFMEYSETFFYIYAEKSVFICLKDELFSSKKLAFDALERMTDKVKNEHSIINKV